MKISLNNLDKIMDRCTKKEIDFLIYVGQFQDVNGVIKGIEYKEVMREINISKSTFYKIIVSLEEKEIIKINYFNEYSYWEIQILDNVFACREDYKKGYLNLNFEVLHGNAFISMTKSEKLIVLHLLRINDFRKSKIKITYKKIMEWTGKSLRSVKKFLETLSQVFNIIQQDNLCMFDCLTGFSTTSVSEADIKNTYTINYRLKKHKCEADIQDIKDTCTVLKQYKITKTESIICLIDKVLDNFGTLMPRYFNKLARLYSADAIV